MSRKRDTMGSGLRELVGAEVLVIDKDDAVQKGMTQLLSAARLHVTCEGDPDAGLARMKDRFFSVAIVDLDTPEPADGLETMRRIKEVSPTTMVVMLTPRKSFDDAVKSLRAGAVDIVWKSAESVPYLKDRVMEAAGRSVGKREVNSILADVRDTYDDFLKRFMDAERRAFDAERANRSSDADSLDEVLQVLVVAPDTRMKEALAGESPDGFEFHAALTGGEALDRVGSGRFHLAMVHAQLPDLPGSMVVRSIKTQSPDTIVLAYELMGKIEVVESTRTVTLVDEFASVNQLIERMDELSEAFHVKSRERRYTQNFRERHYDFLRRYVELKMKIDRTLGAPTPPRLSDADDG